MLDTVTAICAEETPADGAETVDRRRHGRQEHRRVETFDVSGRLDQEWRGLVVAVARVSRLTWHKDTKSASGTRPRRCPSTPVRPPYPPPRSAPPSKPTGASREDNSRIRIKPGAFARMRSFALNILRANGAASIARELYVNALNPLHALAYSAA